MKIRAALKSSCSKSYAKKYKQSIYVGLIRVLWEYDHGNPYGLNEYDRLACLKIIKWYDTANRKQNYSESHSRMD